MMDLNIYGLYPTLLNFVPLFLSPCLSCERTAILLVGNIFVLFIANCQ